MMKPSPRAIRLGVFTLLGLALLVGLFVAIFGSTLFARTDRALLRFGHTVQGLAVGGPVVMRGVRVGTVKSIDIQTNPRTGRFEVPVVVEIDHRQLRDLNPQPGVADRQSTLEQLVAHGLVAQLQLQSMLTGQLYVDLDLPIAPSATTQAVRMVGDAVEIPTRASRLQSLQQQLETVDFGKMARDVTELVAQVKATVGSPQLKQAIDDVAGAAAALKAVGVVVEKRLPGLADSTEATLAVVRKATPGATLALERVRDAADRTGAAAERVGAASRRAEAALAPDSPLLGSLVRTSDELARTAQALQGAVADDSNTLRSVDATLKDLGRASRSLRELADTLEQRPDSLLRGRGDLSAPAPATDPAPWPTSPARNEAPR